MPAGDDDHAFIAWQKEYREKHSRTPYGSHLPENQEEAWEEDRRPPSYRYRDERVSPTVDEIFQIGFVIFVVIALLFAVGFVMFSIRIP